MLKKINKKIKILIFLIIIILCAWFFAIQPLITFHSNENKMETAARRYYELNSRELPAGERVKTLSLQKLYDGGLLEKDFFIPLTKKTCSNENSWVKVRKESGEYKYYTYLECGRYKSKIDHEGPIITLNGEQEIQIDKDSKYEEQGVKSVKDAVDGELKVSDVTIKGKVDTSKIGTYEIEYIAFDSMSNKATVTRKVKVVRRLYKEVKEQLGNDTNFSGEPDNNYIRLSNMMFRIYGVDENKNVIVVSEGDLANVNYSKVDKWLEYFYDNLNDNTKKLIVKNKYCNMSLNESELNKKECDSYIENKKVYIPSIVEVNKASETDEDNEDEENFMKPSTMSWVATAKKESKEAYLTRNVFFGKYSGYDYMAYPVTDNYGVRPMFTIKGTALIQNGDGAYNNPYSFGDTKTAKGGSLLNERETGEYIAVDGVIFRIIGSEKDGTTKVISDINVGGEDELTCTASESHKIEYNPKNKTSVAYFLNNKAPLYVNTSYFIKHSVEVPIYKDNIVYGEEVETKKYDLVLSAPNMYEIFSAQSTALNTGSSYWLINTSKANDIAVAIQDIGVPTNGKISIYARYGIRVVGYLKKDLVVSSGRGTYNSPYMIK